MARENWAKQVCEGEEEGLMSFNLEGTKMKKKVVRFRCVCVVSWVKTRAGAVAETWGSNSERLASL